eukprot:scaffold8292_cov120-Isochrysis_galbana.AAC.8
MRDASPLAVGASSKLVSGVCCIVFSPGRGAFLLVPRPTLCWDTPSLTFLSTCGTSAVSVVGCGCDLGSCGYDVPLPARMLRCARPCTPAVRARTAEWQCEKRAAVHVHENSMPLHDTIMDHGS